MLDHLRYVALALVLLASSSCNSPSAVELAASQKHDTATQWYDLALTLTQKTPGFSPPPAARAFAYMGVALYEAVWPGAPGYQSLAGQLRALEELPTFDSSTRYHWPTVANAALAQLTKHIYSNMAEEQKQSVDKLYGDLKQACLQNNDSKICDDSDNRGIQVADAIYEWSKGDAGHEGHTRNFPAWYAPPKGFGLWEPTPRKDPTKPKQGALQPNWGNNRPLALSANDLEVNCAPPTPTPYSEASNSQFYQEAEEVRSAVNNPQGDERAIALFWADSPGETATPPGHSISIVTQMLRQENASLFKAAEAYAKVGIAVNDAFIACWHSKFVYNLLRPITYIQKIIDPKWDAVLDTPPFPEYPSGHSMQMSASATVMTQLFGENHAFTDNTHSPARSFDSFNQAAREAGLSRLYAGIHFRPAIENGLVQGQCIGRVVNGLKFKR